MDVGRHFRAAAGKVVACAVILAVLGGCATSDGKTKNGKDESVASKDEASHPDGQKSDQEVKDRATAPLKLDLKKRMSAVPERRIAPWEKRSFKFHAKKMQIKSALDLFARVNNLNIIIEPDVTGKVSVDFRGLPFKTAMGAILDANNYHWVREGSLIRVYKYETKIFSIDYVRLVRKGAGQSQVSLSSGAGGDEATGEISITQSDEVAFWENLEKQLGEMISEKDGKLIVNRMSGTIQVTDIHKNVVKVENFLKMVTGSILRQVEIEVQITEVTLNDESSYGINWNQVVNELAGVSIETTNILTSSFGSTTPSASNFSVAYGNLGGDNFNAVLNALSLQGKVKVVSKPKIRVMNNQPALIKVGTDTPYFSGTSSTDSNGNVTTVYEVNYIIMGVVLSITPQISNDGWIMLDVTPIVTRLTGTEESPDGSSAPVTNVNQSSTIVRLKDGEMATIGGLIQSEDSETTTKIPLLGDIPILGKLFQGKHKYKSETELVVFITPRIVRD